MPSCFPPARALAMVEELTGGTPEEDPNSSGSRRRAFSSCVNAAPRPLGPGINFVDNHQLGAS